MDVLLHFKNLKKTDEIEDYVEKKVGSIARKFRIEPLAAEMDLIKRGKGYVCKCKLGHGGLPVVTATEFEVMACVDSLVEKINAVLRRDKDKRIKKVKRTKSHTHYHNGFYEIESQEPWPIDFVDHDDIRYYLDIPLSISSH